MEDKEEKDLVPSLPSASSGLTSPLDKKETDYSQFAIDEVTKATISQSIGTLIYPITREIATLEEAGIKKLKSALSQRKKKKLAEYNQETIKEIEIEVENDLNKAEKVEKLYILFDEASKRELDDKDIFILWSSLISRLKDDDKDYEYLLDILKTITPSEAEFILNFNVYGRQININPVIKSLSFSHHVSDNSQRFEQIADTLKDKGIIEQPFPVVRAVVALLLPTLFFLVGAEVYRPLFDKMGINVSSANNVILMGVAGVLLGVSLLGFLKKHTRFTWVGKKLHDGGMKVYRNKEKI